MREAPVSKISAYARPLIQRMQMVSKDNQVRFGLRFENECMGAHEFERCLMAARLRELNESIRLVEFNICGYDVRVAYLPKHFPNDGQVLLYLEDLFYDRIRTSEWTNFRPDYLLETLELQRKYKRPENKLLKMPARTNAWFDIERGVFWTVEKINLKDIPLNIRKSVEFMDEENKKG